MATEKQIMREQRSNRILRSLGITERTKKVWGIYLGKDPKDWVAVVWNGKGLTESSDFMIDFIKRNR